MQEIRTSEKNWDVALFPAENRRDNGIPALALW